LPHYKIDKFLKRWNLKLIMFQTYCGEIPINYDKSDGDNKVLKKMEYIEHTMIDILDECSRIKKEISTIKNSLNYDLKSDSSVIQFVEYCRNNCNKYNKCKTGDYWKLKEMYNIFLTSNGNLTNKQFALELKKILRREPEIYKSDICFYF